jgi:SAM-dependent methyltransferase
MNVNVGCGGDYREGWWNVDVRRDVKTDLCHDLDDGPLPWPEPVDVVLLNDVLEHLSVGAVENITRSLRVGGLLTGTTPHYLSRNAYNEFSHCRFISINTFRDSLVFRKYRVVSLQIIYELTRHLQWTMPYWFVRLQERVFPGILPPTRILFTLEKVRE